MTTPSHAPATPAARANTAPPLRRGAMTPRPWLGFWPALGEALRWQLAALLRLPRQATVEPPPWLKAARHRRRSLIWLVLAVTLLATHLQWQAVLPSTAFTEAPLAWAAAMTFVGLFAVLFAWVFTGFATALAGFAMMLRGDAQALGLGTELRRPIPREVRTALVMPICNEDVQAVFAGLRATCQSLAATGALSAFDVYVLSDTADESVRHAELAAWQQLRTMLGDDQPGQQRLFYRWRKRRTGRKAGNVADFCRRWGRLYRYMVVLDADSVMTGDCLVRLVQLMERNPRVGIAQTRPEACAPDTLHARCQQFASQVLGRLYIAGLHYWQLGQAHYWGHNAIIRVEPFMQHCALARLPGRNGKTVEVMSHDFVEAAMMCRAGYEVWLVPELDGSYEQLPAHLFDELQRDRRWCHGNLRNARLIAEPGVKPVHRVMFATGVMAYLSAPLWLAYVMLGLWQAQHGDAQRLGNESFWLWGMTLVMLVVPRLLAALVARLRGQQRQFGGSGRLLFSTAVEGVFAMLLAPVRMLAHSVFVISAMLGIDAGWKSPPRQAAQVGWNAAWSRPGAWANLLGLGLLLVVWQDPDAALRLGLLAVPLLLTVPIAVATSRLDWGTALRRVGVMRVPGEALVPAPLRPPSLEHAQPRRRPQPSGWAAPALAHMVDQFGPQPARRWAPRFAATALAVALVVQPSPEAPHLARSLFERSSSHTVQASITLPPRR
ncbi:MAG: glucans biosynthesis glucosyltransferase MdoH [Burkholderiales bacterium]